MIAGSAAKKPGHVVALDCRSAKLELARRLRRRPSFINIAEGGSGGGRSRRSPRATPTTSTSKPRGTPRLSGQGLNCCASSARCVEYSVFGTDVDGGLVDHLRRQGARRPRSASGPALLASGHPDDRGADGADRRIVTHQLPLGGSKDGLDFVADRGRLRQGVADPVEPDERRAALRSRSARDHPRHPRGHRCPRRPRSDVPARTGSRATHRPHRRRRLSSRSPRRVHPRAGRGRQRLGHPRSRRAPRRHGDGRRADPPGHALQPRRAGEANRPPRSSAASSTSGTQPDARITPSTCSPTPTFASCR